MSSFSSTICHTEHYTSVPAELTSDPSRTEFPPISSPYSFYLQRNDQRHSLPLTSTTFYRNENALQHDQRTVYIRRFPAEGRIFCQDDETKEENENDQCDEFHARQTITVRQIDCQDMKRLLLTNELCSRENERSERNAGIGANSSEIDVRSSHLAANIKRSSAETRQFPTGSNFALSSMPFASEDHQQVDGNE